MVDRRNSPNMKRTGEITESRDDISGRRRDNLFGKFVNIVVIRRNGVIYYLERERKLSAKSNEVTQLFKSLGGAATTTKLLHMGINDHYDALTTTIDTLSVRLGIHYLEKFYPEETRTV